MDEFIKAMKDIDWELQENIKYKLKHGKKLEEYEELYLMEMYRFIHRQNKKINCKGRDTIETENIT